VRYSGRELHYVGHWLGRQGPPLEIIPFGSESSGAPGLVITPQVFTFEPGKTKLNAGLEAALATMKPGEHRTVVVPAAQGYGRSGMYGPEVAGKRRFVISPDTMLVYDVEVLM